MGLTAFVALVRKDLQLFFSDRRSVILTFAVPIAIASFFGSIFRGSGDNDEPAKISIAIVDRDDPPVAAVESFQPAMQRVDAVVRRKLHYVTIERKARTGDTVGVAPDGRAEELPAGEISLERVMTEHHIIAESGSVRHEQCLQARAIGDDAHFQPVGGLQDDTFDVGPVRKRTEVGTG